MNMDEQIKKLRQPDNPFGNDKMVGVECQITITTSQLLALVQSIDPGIKHVTVIYDRSCQIVAFEVFRS